MTRREPAGAIRQPYNSGSGADDGLDFIRCVGGRQPQIQKVWSFGNDGITREVHPFARLDVGAFSKDCFGTNQLAEYGHRVSMCGRNSIDVSVECLGFPRFGCDDGPLWNDNILVTIPRWGVGGTV